MIKTFEDILMYKNVLGLFFIELEYFEYDDLTVAEKNLIDTVKKILYNFHLDGIKNIFKNLDETLKIRILRGRREDDFCKYVATELAALCRIELINIEGLMTYK